MAVSWRVVVGVVEVQFETSENVLRIRQIHCVNPKRIIRLQGTNIVGRVTCPVMAPIFRLAVTVRSGYELTFQGFGRWKNLDGVHCRYLLSSLMQRSPRSPGYNPLEAGRNGRFELCILGVLHAHRIICLQVSSPTQEIYPIMQKKRKQMVSRSERHTQSRWTPMQKYNALIISHPNS
jgi:hypothetical protein